MVHGTNRNADHYFDTAKAAAFLAGAIDDTVVIAPRIVVRHRHARAERGRLAAAAATAGGPAAWRRRNPTLSSFDFVDEILRKLAKKNVFPNMKAIVVAGHSAGGQFVNRYEMANKVHDTLGVPVTYVVANPSSYAWPDADAAAAGRRCGCRRTRRPAGTSRRVHTKFTFGPFDASKAAELQPLADRSGRTAPAATRRRSTDEQLKKQLVSRPTTYLLGQVDTLPLGGFDSSARRWRRARRGARAARRSSSSSTRSSARSTRS